MSTVLVINSGSSSFKYQLIDSQSGEVFAQGLVERIGSDSGRSIHEVAGQDFERELPIPDYQVGFGLMISGFREFGPNLADHSLVAIGHRVVQGGDLYSGPVLIDDEVLVHIDRFSSLAPLHNPPAVVCIQQAREAFADVPHIAIFDTAFHQTMPIEHYSYAVNPELAAKHGIRKYGFHGTSHGYVAKKAAEFLRKPLEASNFITLHLGNGASATAIKNGVSINTSMGMTPLEGLVMGTRSGDIDPGVLFHLHRTADYTIEDLDKMLNRNAGLFGMTGSQDMRDVQLRAREGDSAAQTGLQIYYERIKHYIGGYYAQLGSLDALIFTAGVGENSVPARVGILEGLAGLGIIVDAELNEQSSRETRLISTVDSPVKILVVPTNEELEIAQQAVELISKG